MGRAIVRDPKVFLFDEPLSNLDAKLRVQMRSEIRDLHRRLETTCIYVTHDQIEAMTMADKIVVMNNGVVEQIGSPLGLYDRPENVFVASFLGSPAMNFLEGSLVGGDRPAFVANGGFFDHPRHVARPIPAGRFVRLPAGGRRSWAAKPLPAIVGVVEPTGSETCFRQARREGHRRRSRGNHAAAEAALPSPSLLETFISSTPRRPGE